MNFVGLIRSTTTTTTARLARNQLGASARPQSQLTSMFARLQLNVSSPSATRSLSTRSLVQPAAATTALSIQSRMYLGGRRYGSGLRTHKATAKRWRAVGGGGFKHARPNRIHLNYKMTAKRRRHLNAPAFANNVHKKWLRRRLLPN
ncbi:hypothetical protein GQ42DRAFT_75241 [Ramicandelaber brevisporus]|nr:hypothetical protein GQ42DRAFT_75241 [Ramicandelaber brevisporus]